MSVLVSGDNVVQHTFQSDKMQRGVERWVFHLGDEIDFISKLNQKSQMPCVQSFANQLAMLKGRLSVSAITPKGPLDVRMRHEGRMKKNVGLWQAGMRMHFRWWQPKWEALRSDTQCRWISRYNQCVSVPLLLQRWQVLHYLWWGCWRKFHPLQSNSDGIRSEWATKI